MKRSMERDMWPSLYNIGLEAGAAGEGGRDPRSDDRGEPRVDRGNEDTPVELERSSPF